MLTQRLAKLHEAKQLKEEVDIVLHKEAVLKARLKPWLDEAYAVTWNIEGKFVTLQATQKKFQADNIGVVTEKRVEDTKQVAAQCRTKVAIIWVKLEGLHTKISAPTD